MSEPKKPLVLVHLLARNKEKTLVFYLETMAQWDYPKDRIFLYIRTNNNDDRTSEILEQHIADLGSQYAKVIYENEDIDRPITGTDNHDWTAERLNVLRKLRDKGLSVATEQNCDFYFVSDVDNYLLPHTLSELVSQNLPVVAPFLRLAVGDGEKYDNEHIALAANPDNYSNFDIKVLDVGDTRNGEFQHLFEPEYYEIFNQTTTGLFQVALVHCTYLLRRDVFTTTSYQNGYNGYDYIIFCYNLRIFGIPMYLDNREVYGCMTLAENESACREYLTRLQKDHHDQHQALRQGTL